MLRPCLATALLACTPALADPGPQSLELACTGAFARDSDKARVEQVFGKENVKEEEIDGPEGTTYKATVIYGKDAAKRIAITWWDEEGRRRPSTIRLDDDKTAWRLAGLKVGSPVADLNKANGKAFKIAGFDWDYGGWVTSWEKGKVETLGGKDCSVAARLSYRKDLPDSMSGDGVTVTSSDKRLAAGQAYVSDLSLNYSDK